MVLEGLRLLTFVLTYVYIFQFMSHPALTELLTEEDQKVPISTFALSKKIASYLSPVHIQLFHFMFWDFPE